MIAFLASPLGRYLLIGGAIALVVGGVLLYVYNQGEAAAVAAATATALERTAAAARARAKVRPNDQEAMNADSHNRDARR